MVSARLTIITRGQLQLLEEATGACAGAGGHPAVAVDATRVAELESLLRFMSPECHVEWV
jgi:hypothetical protein